MRMARFEIQIRRRGRERRVELGRLTSAVATIVLTVLAIAVLVLALVFGYLVLGFVLAVVLVSIVVAVARGAWSNLRR
jgi:uncharacterized membrane protein